MTTATPTVELRAASLFDVDVELAELVDPRHVEEARAHSALVVADLGRGQVDLDEVLRLAQHPFAIMLLEGVVVREVVLGATTASELLGPTDVVDIGTAAEAVLNTATVWNVPERARVAVLDDRLLLMLRRWPSIGRILLARAAQREARICVHRAIAQLPRVEQRVLAFFAYLAERWGRVAPGGLIVPVHLTHEGLGRLIGARRPTVSLALKQLATAELLVRRDDGAWLLPPHALAQLDAETAEPAGWQPAEAHTVELSGDGPPVAPPPGHPRRGISAEEVAELRGRVDRLRAAHSGRVAHSASVLEHSRETRRARLTRHPVNPA
jgi:CRP/FNR family transcriptional regulator, cyclic AMP receptor protein